MKEKDEPMVINFGWKHLAGISMRYISHIFFARMENGELIAPPTPSPYAHIFVEAPELPNIGMIQVSHKLDFYNLWILDEKGILNNKDVELIIKHKPHSGFRKLMAAILPHLEYSVFHRGHLEAIHNPEKRESALEQTPYIYLYDQERR